MSNIECLYVESPWEDPGNQRSGQEGSMVVRVRETSEDRYEADFRLALTGVVNSPKEVKTKDGRDRLTWIDDSIYALLASLSDGQEIVMNYGWRHELEKPSQFSLEIAGASTGTTGADALESARELFHSLQVAMGNPALGFQFSPSKSTHEEPTSGLNFTYLLEPAAISIPITNMNPIGYMGARPSDRQVILAFPANKNGVSFDSVIRAGGASPAAFTVSLHVEGIRLTEGELDVIEAAFEHLRIGEAGQIRVDGSRSGRIYDEGMVASTLFRLERWLGDPRGYRVHCTVQADGPLPISLLEIIGNELFRGIPVSVHRITEMSAIERQDASSIINLAGCFHRTDSPLNLLPDTETLQSAGVPRVYSAPHLEFSPKGLVLGHCERQHGGQSVKLADIDRSRHCYVIGATGTGKSTLLYNMICQDIEHGRGLCMIDPHGDLYEQVVNSIPVNRANDVILMDLSDTKYSVGINFLECSGVNNDVQMNFIVNEMMTIIGRLYNMSIAGGPAFESYMRNALLAVMGIESRTATLLDVVRFFEDNDFRQYVKEKSRNVLAVSFWNRQAEKVQGDWALTNMAPYITCKLNQFTHNALLRPIIGQPKSTIDFRKSMDNGKIILVNLAKGILGDFDVRLLGMLLIGKIFNAALGRVSLRREDRIPFYLYVDEFQNLATPTIVALLSEARKFGLSLTMANQHLGQLSEDAQQMGITDAILGNVATMLLFRMGPKDAEKLETYTMPYLNAHDLQHLPDHHVACRMLNNNVPVPSFVFKTLAVLANKLAEEDQQRIHRSIRRRTRRVFSRKREVIEREIGSEWRRKPGNIIQVGKIRSTSNPTDVFNFTARVSGLIKEAAIETILDFVTLSEEQLLDRLDIQKGTQYSLRIISYVNDALSESGFHLSMSATEVSRAIKEHNAIIE